MSDPTEPGTPDNALPVDEFDDDFADSGVADLAAEAARLTRVEKKADKKNKQRHAIRIEHKVPGRIRMRIPAAKDNPKFLKLFQNVFSAIPGIVKVKAKPDTGSIVIHYDPNHEAEFQREFTLCCAQHDMAVQSALPGDEIGEMAKKIQAEAEFLAQRSEGVRVAVEFFKRLDYQIKATTDNTIDLKIVLVGGLAVATFVQIGAEAATPMWVTLALFGVNHFIEMKQEGRSPTAAPASA
jgi:hypothetical protein